MKRKTLCIGITMGDPSGIGPEIIAKALSKTAVRRLAQFKIIGDQAIYQRSSVKQFENIHWENLHSLSSRNLKPGEVSKDSGRASLAYLQRAIQLLKEGQIDALVTAPVNKEAVCLTEPSFKGHTEYLADAFNVKNVGMMFVADKLKVMLATRHIPIKDVSRVLDRRLVGETIRLTYEGLTKMFKIKRPIMAVCGLNPHAGEAGHIGKEEAAIIRPAVKQCQKKGMIIEGPLAADSLFIPSMLRKFDAVVAMYHDQGLIPVKAMCFNRLVNLTVGLPFIRTSPAHGTALDIAGRNQADASSMIQAIQLAVQLSDLRL